jgi:diaminopimelate decarboxylase
MDGFNYHDGRLGCEDLALSDLAQQVGTPCYVYSQAAIEQRYRELAEAFASADPLICYSVKANGNLAVLDLLRRLGSGFDIVSAGELFRVRQVGGDMAKTVFAGVGKTADEIRQALEADLLMFNAESRSELDTIERAAADLDTTARIALRLNPDVDPKTHHYITTGKRENKFGIDLEAAREIVGAIEQWPHLRLIGYHAHIGSQVTDPKPHADSLGKLVDFADACPPSNSAIEYINVGGGFGIDYAPGQAVPAADFAELILPLIQKSGKRLILEPGRYIMGNSGILLTRVAHVKRSGDRRFVICDAAMTDLIRPALYDAYHAVWPVCSDAPFEENGCTPADIVGGVCESGDFLAKDRRLPEVQAGALLAVFSAGAYGFAMSSNYNARPRPVEVLVHGNDYRVVRRRERYEDLIRLETP